MLSIIHWKSRIRLDNILADFREHLFIGCVLKSAIYFLVKILLSRICSMFMKSNLWYTIYVLNSIGILLYKNVVNNIFI